MIRSRGRRGKEYKGVKIKEIGREQENNNGKKKRNTRK